MLELGTQRKLRVPCDRMDASYSLIVLHSRGMAYN
ncbi:hypothetical protein A3Q41_04287 [Rhodococcoides fascians]|uniref:Uncharacterized protein n=1 Tax=Rhodococcoides fascians TaxID=1828 RepID=A0A143QQW8_RHOFA|nr:hypothetical protein A3Q41_04287 [Rhodococcus fascians]